MIHLIDSKSATRLTLLALLSSPLLFGGCTLSVGPNSGANAAVARENSSSTSLTLKRMLDAEDSQVRALVARELGEIGPAAIDAVPSLHRLTEDPDRHVRLQAARALLLIDPNDRIAVPSLVMTINDPATSLDDRIAALTLLQQSGPKGQAALAMHNASTGGASPGALNRTQRSGYATTQPSSAAGVFETRRTQTVETQDRAIQASDLPADPSTPERTNVTTERLPATPAEPIPVRRDPPVGTDPSSSVSAPTQAIVMADSSSPAAAQVVAAASVGAAPAATQPDAPTATIAGLEGLDTASAPQPDINLYGLRSYTSTQANLLRVWIERQSSLSEAQKQVRFRDFHRWRTEQDRLIYQKALER